MANKSDRIITNFRKAESSIKKIIEMLDGGEYCIDIMQQNLAAIGLLRSAHRQLMERHLNTCFKSAMESDNVGRQKKVAGEILRVTQMSAKEIN